MVEACDLHIFCVFFFYGGVFFFFGGGGLFWFCFFCCFSVVLQRESNFSTDKLESPRFIVFVWPGLMTGCEGSFWPKEGAQNTKSFLVFLLFISVFLSLSFYVFPFSLYFFHIYLYILSFLPSFSCFFRLQSRRSRRRKRKKQETLQERRRRERTRIIEENKDPPPPK